MPNSTAQPGLARSRHAPIVLVARLCLVSALLVLPGQLIAQPDDATTPGPVETLNSPEITPEERSAAADLVLALPGDDPSFPAAVAILAESSSDAARALLAAIARTSQPSAVWLRPCIDLVRDPDAPLAREAVLALGSFRTREAVAALVDIVADSRPPEVEDAAAESLARLSARDDILPDGWREYLAHALTLSERQWEQQLLLAHVRKAESLRAAADVTARDLVEAWRQIHLLTPQTERSEILTRLLQSQTPSLRSLGFDLINREIGESRQLEPTVTQAAIELLGSSEPLVRAQAALLVNRLAPPEAESAIIAALDHETDPRAAEALLFAASRWPSAVMIKPVLRWLDVTPALRLRATATAWTLLRADLLTDPADRAAVLAGARAIETADLTPPACRILATLGSEQDLARLHDLLIAETTAHRSMAADALALRADQVDTLLAAATSDATLFEPCARALQTHLQDARGFAALSSLPAPSPQVRARVLADYAALLPTEEIIRLARLAADPTEALHLLRPLTAADRAVDPAVAPQLADGLLLLSQTYIALANPTDAFAAISLVPEGVGPAEPLVLDNLRVTLLLWLNRIDQAEAIESAPEAWLDALEYAETEPHASLIAERFAARFTELTPEHVTRLDAIRQRLAEASQPPPPTEGG